MRLLPTLLSSQADAPQVAWRGRFSCDVKLTCCRDSIFVWGAIVCPDGYSIVGIVTGCGCLDSNLEARSAASSAFNICQHLAAFSVRPL